MLNEVITKMEQMFKKYWKRISYLYSFGFILDPRWRLDSYLEVLPVIESNLNWAEGTPQTIYNYATEKFYAFYKTCEEFRAEETQPPDVLPTAHPSPLK